MPKIYPIKFPLTPSSAQKAKDEAREKIKKGLENNERIFFEALQKAKVYRKYKYSLLEAKTHKKVFTDADGVTITIEV